MIDIGSIVKFHSLGGDELEGRYGQIVGIYADWQSVYPNMWIVKVWDKPKSMRGDCLVMTGACLEEAELIALADLEFRGER